MKYLEERKFKTKYNKEQWEIILLENNQLSFRNKDSLDDPKIISISPDDIIEQVSDYEFLVINSSKKSSEEREMVVLNLNVLKDEDIDVHYQCFTHCYALSDDLLLFKNAKKKVMRNRGKLEEITGDYAVYSIKAGGNLKDFEWLSKGYDISAINLSNDEDKNKIFLYITKVIESEHANDYVQFVVDPVKFQPISEIHSTLRDMYIPVSSKEEVISIIQEDCQNKMIVDFYSSETNEFSLNKVKVKLLSEIEE